jgi:hypothetical protein
LAGLADISPHLLKKCVPYILKPLLELVSISSRQGIFPSILKISVIKYKNGLKEDANNNCPVVLVLALSKIMGKSNSQFIFLTDTTYLINSA